MNETFPYKNYRKEQFSIISSILNESSKTLLIDAETGSGKTAAVLSAILSRKKPNERIIIFTKMLGQMDAWFRELGLINDFNRKIGNNRYSIIPLVGKSNVCHLVSRDLKKIFNQIGCSLFDCHYSQAFHIMKNDFGSSEQYSNQILSEIQIILKEGVSLSEVLWNLENKIDNYGCPYFALKTALEFSEIVITTYPFLTQPNLREILFKDMNLDISATTFVIDEAHNLAKSVFAELSYKALDKAFSEMGSHEILEQLQNLRDQEGLHNVSFDERLLQDLEERGRKYLLWRFDNGYKDISYTLKVCEFLKNTSFCYLTSERKFSLFLKDPRTILNPIKHANQVILISGTFRPLDDFADFLGVRNAQKIAIQSEKLGHNRIILTTSDSELTMKYRSRTPEMFVKYGNEINKLANIIPRHVLVFTPNYEITLILANILNSDFYEKPNQDVSKLISSVIASDEKKIIIAPARGKVSEGIEFVKDDQSLISSVIVAGLPYPPPSKALSEIIKEYGKFWGEDKATNYMNYLQATVTMRQCLGRMIRSENDVGSWIILDNRISNMDVFPRAIECKNTDQMIERLIFFYKQHNQI